MAQVKFFGYYSDFMTLTFMVQHFEVLTELSYTEYFKPPLKKVFCLVFSSLMRGWEGCTISLESSVTFGVIFG